MHNLIAIASTPGHPRRTGVEAKLAIASYFSMTMQLVNKLKWAIKMARFMAKLGLSLKDYSRNVDQQQTLEQV